MHGVGAVQVVLHLQVFHTHENIRDLNHFQDIEADKVQDIFVCLTDLLP